MSDKALDAGATAWLDLESADGLRAKVRALSSAERNAVLAGIDKPPVLGFALQKQRAEIGADLPEREANAARLAWVESLSPERVRAMAAAQTYHWRRGVALVSAGVEALTIDGEDFGSASEVVEMVAASDAETGADLLAELAGLVTEFGTLGKAGPMCSARLHGAPTLSTEDGPASDAQQPREQAEGTAAAPSLSPSVEPSGAQTEARSATTEGA